MGFRVTRDLFNGWNRDRKTAELPSRAFGLGFWSLEFKVLGHMNYSPNSLKGDVGDKIGECYMGLMKGDIRSLDNSSNVGEVVCSQA